MKSCSSPCSGRAARRCVVAALALLAPWSAAWAQAAAQPACLPIDGPAYLGGHDAARTSVVVFVHGVLSDARGAWSRSEDQSWPCLLRNEPAFDNSNIYLYGYDTGLLGSSPSTEKVADHLLTDLLNDQVLNHAHVTIVAHSMGGLVLSRALLKMHTDPLYATKLGRIKLVQFYGTPATGADISNLASFFSSNAQFEEMRTGQQQNDLIDRWASVQWPFPWYCLAEGRRTGWSWLVGTMVVPPESAKALCKTRPKGFEVLEHFDHLTMVKPVSLQDTPHRYLQRNFLSCVRAALPRQEPPSEAGTPEGRLMVDTLNMLRKALADDSAAGAVAALRAVQGALYVSDGWADQYVMPSSMAPPSLVAKDFDRLTGRAFALEFLKLFQRQPADLSPAWVGRLGTLHRYVADGQLIELRRAWTAAGLMDDNDTVVALEPRTGGDQIFVLGGVQPVPTGGLEARIRGLLAVPPQPRVCR